MTNFSFCFLQDSLQDQMTQESFVPYGHQDILTIVIGQLEHPSHVRAMGLGVTISQYFGHASHGSKSSTSIIPQHLTKMIQNLKEEWKIETKEENK